MRAFTAPVLWKVEHARKGGANNTHGRHDGAECAGGPGLCHLFGESGRLCHLLGGFGRGFLSSFRWIRQGILVVSLVGSAGGFCHLWG